LLLIKKSLFLIKLWIEAHSSCPYYHIKKKLWRLGKGRKYNKECFEGLGKEI